ncbi:MAG: patatin-like phospholipase family protein [Deltaproteobacteria bacterium]|nr:patatin-like phospholipase family protein [Deltaproteobacteria bacterium]MBW2137825.1 patatin-like phospholipase family protein [Deltaproteobacteria bacterium]
MFWRRKSVALALGGGGARGLAHIGVLRVLEREGIPIDLIVGTSVGALVGGAYACGITADELERRAEEYLNSSEFRSSAMKGLEAAYRGGEEGLGEKIRTYVKNRFLVVQAMFKPGILSNQDFQKTISYFLPDIEIEETRTPFRAVATDLVSGQQIVLSRGSLRQAVMASCAVPGAIEPLKEGERLLSNGGITCLIPCSVARQEGADIIIAVAVDRGISRETEIRTVVDIYHRVSEIMGEKLKALELSGADVVISPEVGDLHWTEFSQAMNLIEIGERAAREKLVDMRLAISPFRKWLRFVGRRIATGSRSYK